MNELIRAMSMKSITMTKKRSFELDKSVFLELLDENFQECTDKEIFGGQRREEVQFQKERRTVVP